MPELKKYRLLHSYLALFYIIIDYFCKALGTLYFLGETFYTQVPHFRNYTNFKDEYNQTVIFVSVYHFTFFLTV